MQEEIERDDTKFALLAGRSLDIKVAVAALLVFAGFMFFLLWLLFPQGLTLDESSLGQANDARSDDARREASFSNTGARTGTVVAEVLSIRRDVKVKGRDELAWSSAEAGVKLADQDSLQTQRNSGATVQLDDESVVKVGPNSLIVFQGGVRDLFTPRQTNSIVMMAGSLDAQFASSPGSPRHLEVALPNGLARFIPGDNDAAVAFNINVNPDLSSSVSVISGSGVVTVAGKTQTVDAEHGITISINGELLEEGRLPGRPDGIRPRNRAVYEYRALPPEIVFGWDAVPGIDTYRLKVARDAGMNDLVIDQNLGQRTFAYSGLTHGTYYWQVSGRHGLMEGPAAGPNLLRLVRDEQPPRLALQAMEYTNGAVTVRGSTDPGVRIYIQGDEIVTDSGHFERDVSIDPGTSLIMVEAVDAAGNVTYDSQIINTNTFSNGGGK